MRKVFIRRYLAILALILPLLLISCGKYDRVGYQKEINTDYVSNQNENAKVKNIILQIMV